MARPLSKTVRPLLTKPDVLLPYAAAIALLGLFPKELKTYVHAETCTWMFLAASFMVAQTRTQAFSRGTDKLWSIRTVE